MRACRKLLLYDKQSENARRNTDRLKFQDFNICPNILHVDADTDADANAEGIAIALLHLKCRLANKLFIGISVYILCIILIRSLFNREGGGFTELIYVNCCINTDGQLSVKVKFSLVWSAKR